MDKKETECDTLICNILSIKDRKGLSFLPEMIQTTINWKSKDEMNNPRWCWMRAELEVPGIGAAVKLKLKNNVKKEAIYFISYESTAAFSAVQVGRGLNGIK